MSNTKRLLEQTGTSTYPDDLDYDYEQYLAEKEAMEDEMQWLIKDYACSSKSKDIERIIQYDIDSTIARDGSTYSEHFINQYNYC
jgi:hypothetical protein